MTFPTWKFPSIFIEAMQMAAFSCSPCPLARHTRLQASKICGRIQESAVESCFFVIYKEIFAKSSLTLVDFIFGDSRRFERPVLSISLALCLQNIHEVSSSSWSSSRVCEACFFCFADVFFIDRFEDEFDSLRRDFRFSTVEEDVRGSSHCRISS